MGAVAAISIYVTDLDEAANFYDSILGLKVKHRLPYLVVLEGGGPDVVLCQAQELAKVNYPDGSAVVLGFPTENLTQDIARLQAKGARLIHSTPQDFPDGKYIAFSDPSGNVIELLEFQR